MAFNVGDFVQVKGGAIDVTNGNKAKAGKMFGKGGPKWAEIDKIVKGWKTNSKYGLPAKITKYRLTHNGVVVWQVQEKDLVAYVKPHEAFLPENTQPGSTYTPTNNKNNKSVQMEEVNGNGEPYAIDQDGKTWTNGKKSVQQKTKINMPKKAAKTATISESAYASDSSLQTPTYKAANIIIRDSEGKRKRINFVKNKINGVKKESQKELRKAVKELTASGVWISAAPWKAKYLTSAQSNGRLAELKNLEYQGGKIKASTFIQNGQSYPKIKIPTNIDKDSPFSLKNSKSVEYDYQIIPNDPYYNKLNGVEYLKDKAKGLEVSKPVSLENQLKEVRKSFGIMVHGDNDIARDAKFYMYNRYKVPDTNLAFNRTVTHVFFTRPDLNIISDDVGVSLPNQQVKNHTETAILWRRSPELFKLLTDSRRCKDHNNFNMLLSNQVTSFSIIDEGLSTVRNGKSWKEHEIVYGHNYTGRVAGEFSCTFDETSELSIINLMRLWMLYIDNVSSGAWSPNYTNQWKYNHPYNREIDYGCSAYVFKCGPDGEDVLYWTKYYGVFPISDGASILTWNKNESIGSLSPLSINFAYSMKRDMNPISLLEFNHNARINEEDLSKGWEPGWTEELAGSSLPFVETPYIEIALTNPNFASGNQTYKGQRASIRLKFIRDTSKVRAPKVLYRSHHGISDQTN